MLNERKLRRIISDEARRTINRGDHQRNSLRFLLEADETDKPKVEFPSWLEGKIKSVHGEPGQGSIFADPGSVKDKVLKLIDQKSDEVDEIAKGSGALTQTMSGIGYDLVISTEDAQALPDAVEVEGGVEKVEGPNKVKVPAYKTSAPISQFTTDQLTVIVRPKKDSSGAVLPGEYIVLSAFPGKDLPRASEWGGKYAVIIPDQKKGTAAESASRGGKIVLERWQRIAGLIKG